MANFYATYSAAAPSGASVVATQGTVPWIVTGSGTAGTAATGVVTVQGIAGGTAIPISGSITANNASVGATGSAVPASATYLGATVAGTLTGLVATANGLKVDGSAVTQPVSGTVAVSNFPATQPVSGTVTANAGTGNFTVVQGTGTNLHVVVDSAPSTAVTGTVTANAGTGTFTTDQVATTAATFQDGSIAFGALTTNYQTVVATGGTIKNVSMRNNTNAVIVVSLNGGSTTSYTLDSGDAVSLDLKTLGLNIASSVNLQAKVSGTLPTSGSIRINTVY